MQMNYILYKQTCMEHSYPSWDHTPATQLHKPEFSQRSFLLPPQASQCLSSQNWSPIWKNWMPSSQKGICSMNLVFPRKLNHHRPKYYVNSGEKKRGRWFFPSEHWTLRISMILWFWTRKINANALLFCDIFLFDEIFLRPILVKAIVVEAFSLSLQTCITFNQENPGFSFNYQNHLQC